MATPYNLRSRKRDGQLQQASLQSSQVRRKPSKVVQGAESELESNPDNVKLGSTWAPGSSSCLLRTKKRDVTQKCLKWEEDELEKEEEEDHSNTALERGGGVGGGGGGSDGGSDSEGPEDVPLTTAKQTAMKRLHQQAAETHRSVQGQRD